jgi:hypothetical protein
MRLLRYEFIGLFRYKIRRPYTGSCKRWLFSGSAAVLDFLDCP